ncbi:MAG: dipeptidase [Clostridia bacterium]|nr:dipeptidase [Clostridia bacterium]
MKLSLFDTHCDTASEIWERNQPLDRNSCHIDLEKGSCFENYAQFYAVWSNRRKDDEACWTDFLSVADYFRKEVARLSDRAVMVDSGKGLEKAFAEGRHACILAVEDARLLAGRLERLDILKDLGVRYLTLLWGGPTCIGGSHNTNEGLTDFGKQVVAGCFERGILPDVSHASEQSVDDVIEIALRYNKPFIASHSNSYAVHPHSRNLRDRHFEVLKQLGGVIGINLYTEFVSNCAVTPATLDRLVDHFDHFMALGGEDVIGIGGDLDGCDLTPPLRHVGDLPLIAEALARHNYTEEQIHKIFWKNFYDFSVRNL